jgi:PKHD-type hydroxylase
VNAEKLGDWAPHLGGHTHLAFTLFLCDPATYEGGELCVRTGDIERSCKLSTGNMLLYPTTTPHFVKPALTEQRAAVVGWIQSMVADP